MVRPLRQFLPKRFRKTEVVVPVVRLSGVIMAGGGGPFRSSISLASAAPLLDKAFAMKDAPAVAISINSPGGSPVQSRLVFQRIRDLAEEKGKHVIVACEDLAASGGYMIACAGDEIIADPSTVVGSIGVVSGGFGFVDLIAKLGVERRVHTAGQNKATLDPFRPERPEDVEHLKALQLDVHKTFIDLVQSRRGAKLADHPDLFTGLFWSGVRGLDLGLVDRLGDLRGVVRERYGPGAKLAVVQGRRGLFGRRAAGAAAGLDAASLASALGGGLLDAVQERALWARYGL
ncbi:S49 family peptidase [Aureimonas pseudogalii]|uniref:Signal peptide peptidase SppA n=1 Tax=Aureimonas pseudogalii TaxID=1744844 RepID=A0A7W6E830_9HYPH|nr:S49 family peptidase [Aureimonas pseudogalii]MBB3996443.1 signal peptide peptidase SppA [Aureimonas pseudogalii]